MEQVKVVLYDDLHYHHDSDLIEADASHVLELDGQRVKLDLTDVNFQTLADDLAGYLAAGSPIAAGTTVKPRKHGGRRNFGPHNPEHLAYNRALRIWAAWQDRVSETLVPTGYYYKVQLRKDVSEWLNDHQMTPAQFIDRAEEGEYPAKEGSR